jgi:hypothetical protein
MPNNTVHHTMPHCFHQELSSRCIAASQQLNDNLKVPFLPDVCAARPSGYQVCILTYARNALTGSDMRKESAIPEFV